MSKNKQTNKKKPQPQPDGKKYFQNSIHNVIREEVQHYKLSLRVKTLNRSKPSAETDTRNPAAASGTVPEERTVKGSPRQPRLKHINVSNFKVQNSSRTS